VQVLKDISEINAFFERMNLEISTQIMTLMQKYLYVEKWNDNSFGLREELWR